MGAELSQGLSHSCVHLNIYRELHGACFLTSEVRLVPQCVSTGVRLVA